MDLHKAAREWLSDIPFGDDPEFDHLTDAQVQAAVGRIYTGGWPAFVSDGPQPVTTGTQTTANGSVISRPAGHGSPWDFISLSPDDGADYYLQRTASREASARSQCPGCGCENDDSPCGCACHGTAQ